MVEVRHKRVMKYPSVIERFSSKYKVNNAGCWVWNAGKTDDGYGQFGVKPYWNVRAHRWSYLYYRGRIPEDKQLDHLCRNRICVNPYHLEIVTAKENVRRGLSVTNKLRMQADCKRGHPLSGENLRMTSTGNRACKICGNMLQRKYVALRRKAGKK